MMIKKILSTGLILLATISIAQQKENPKNICKNCGVFDLNKMAFSEKTSDLTAKTEVWKSAIVNHNNELKFEEEITKRDTVKLYKYHFANGRDLILGKKPFNFNGQFNFNNLNLLTDKNNSILALNATVFYDGQYDDISKFIAALKSKYKGFKQIKRSMYGDLSVHQWFIDDQIIQLVTDNKEGEMEQTIDGKTTKSKSTYVKLNIYNRFSIEKSVQKLVDRDTDFVLFDDRHFIK